MNQHCRGNICDSDGYKAAQSGKEESIAATILLPAGVALGTLTTYLVVKSLSSDSSTALAVQPVRAGAAVSVTQRF